MFIQIAISTLLAFLKGTVKNPGKAEKFRSVLLQVRDQINLLFPGE